MKAPWNDIIVLFVTAHLALGCSGLPMATRETNPVSTVGLPVQVRQPNRTAPPNSAANSTANTVTHSAVVHAFGSLPLSFEANDGQTNPEVKYISRGPGYTLFLTDKEAVFTLRKPRQQSSAQNHDRVLAEPVEFSVLRMQLVGAETNPGVVGEEALPGKSNYFIGNDPKKWRADVPHFKKVRYEGVYPGIDLVYYGNQGSRLEYDFVVAPGADPGVIQMAFTGADALNVDDHGTLIIHAGGAEVRLQSPVVYQEVAGQREKVKAQYVIAASGDKNSTNSVQLATQNALTVAFQLAAYDITKPLIIDPVLVYSTYLGGSGNDYATNVAVDSAGNMYVAGQTASTNFPVQNALQGKNSGADDIFITKLNAAGNQRIYSTYLGGSGGEGANAIAVDADGNIYITGGTNSTNFPMMNPFQPKHGGGSDAYLVKLNSTGSALVYSTFLGGNAADNANAIAVDASGQAYLTGATESTNFPTTNALQPNLAGSGDAFVTKINAVGSALIYSTYLGGATNTDSGNGIALDAKGNVYIGGQTYSSDFPTINPIQAVRVGISSDGFVAKINADGSALVYSTYLGGSSFDTVSAVAVDSAGNAYVTGTTESSDFPTMSPIDAMLDGFRDLFATKINADGSAIVYSTYIGGSENEGGSAIIVDAAGNVYIGGSSNSTDFTTVNAIQSKYPGSGLNIPVVLKLNAAGSSIVFSTYFGGSGPANENARGLAVDAIGNMYLAGWTTSTDMPVKNPIQKNISGTFEPTDAFVAKISQVVNCPTNSLQLAIDYASAGETLSVMGTCNENILIRNEKQRIAIDGSGAGAGTRATVNGSSGAPVFNLRGKGILIQNFNVTGGSDGIVVNRGSNAVLNNNVVSNSSGSGVVVEQLAYSVLTNNSIQNHPVSGVSVSENSTARIGFNSDSETVASANTITNNGIGILISQGSSARIVGNTISNNTARGVSVLSDASADLSSNTISGNGGEAVAVGENSLVQLGEDNGSSIFESPNTSGSANTGFGIRCLSGGTLDGRIGTLTGTLGPTSLDPGCMDGLTP